MDSTTLAPADEAAEAAARAIASRRAEYIAGLRLLADALEMHPEAELPAGGTTVPLSITFWGSSARERMAAAARALPCTWTKDYRDGGEGYESYFDLNGMLAGLKIALTAYRDTVCERVVVRTEDREVEEVVTPAETRMVVKSVEIVRWECGSVLKDAAPAEAETTAAA